MELLDILQAFKEGGRSPIQRTWQSDVAKCEP